MENSIYEEFLVHRELKKIQEIKVIRNILKEEKYVKLLSKLLKIGING